MSKNRQHKLILTIKGEITMTLSAEDADEAIIAAEHMFTNATIPIEFRKRKAVLEVYDVDIDACEEA